MPKQDIYIFSLQMRVRGFSIALVTANGQYLFQYSCNPSPSLSSVLRTDMLPVDGPNGSQGYWLALIQARKEAECIKGAEATGFVLVQSPKGLDEDRGSAQNSELVWSHAYLVPYFLIRST